MKRLPKPEEIQTMDDAELLVLALHEKAKKLVRLAQGYGMTLTIETKPRHPLAMGSYDMVITLRPANEMYRLP